MDLIHQGQIISRKNGKEIIECLQCGFKHVNPLPTLEETENIYKNEYYQKEKPNYISENVKDKNWWIATYNRRFEVYEKFITKERRTLLDIGSGPGVFLEAAIKRGWEVTGIEPNTSAAKHTIDLGFNVVNEMYDKSLSDKLDKFDLINLSLVLEHVVNPVELIRLAFNQLNENGIISIVVPNDYSPFQTILNSNFNFEDWWVAPDHHLNYFSRSSLNYILMNNGLKVVHEETTFPIDMFLLMGDNYISNPEMGRVVHKKRIEFETKIMNSGQSDLLTKLYSELSKINIGREIFIICQK